MKISRGKIYKVLLSRNQTKKKKPKKHLHKRKHKKRRTYHKRKRPHLRNKTLKVNKRHKRHKRHKGGSRITGDKNVKKKMQESDNRYQEKWKAATQKYIEDLKEDKAFEDAKNQYNVMKSNLQYRSNFRILGDGLSALFTKKTTDSTTAKQSIHDQIEEFLKVEKLLDMNETELKQNLTNVQQRLNTLLEDNIDEYKDVKSAFSKLGVGVGMVPAIDLALLRLEKKFSTSFEMLAEKINNWKNKTNRSETALNQIKEGIFKTSTLANQISKLMAFLGVPETGNNYGVLQRQKNSMAGFLSQADNNEVWNKYTSRLRGELENIMAEMIDKYKELLGSFISAGMAEQQGTLTTSPPSEYYVFWTKLTSKEKDLLTKQIIASAPAAGQEGIEMSSTGPQVVPSEEEKKKEGIKVSDIPRETETAPESSPSTESESDKTDKTEQAPANSDQGIEMQPMDSTKDCSVYTPQESDDKNFKKKLIEQCNEKENCTFDEETNKCKTKGGTTSSETTSEVEQSSSTTSSDAANAIPQGENIPAATGSVGAQSKRCDDKTWSQVLENAKVSKLNVVALCDAGIEKGEITTSDGTKIETDIPKNKGYKKVEINGDGNCGWYSMLEYFHLYGDKLLIDSSSELGKIIALVKRSTDAAGRGPSGVKEGLAFSKDVVTQLRDYAHSLSGKTDNQLTDSDMQELGKKMETNTICLYESGAEVPKWVYYNDGYNEPGILIPTNASEDYPIPMMLYHTGGSGTDSSKSAGGHYSLLTLGEGDSSKVFNDFKNPDAYTEYLINSYSASPSTETTQASSTGSDCQSEGSCKYNKEFIDYYKTLSIKRPSEWSKEYAKVVDLAYGKAKQAEDVSLSGGPTHDVRGYKITSTKFACETEAYRILSNPDSWAKYDSTYEKCGGKEKADWKPEEVPKQQTTSSPAANAIPQGENIPPPTGQQPSSPDQDEEQQEANAEISSPPQGPQQQDGDTETSSPPQGPQQQQQDGNVETSSPVSSPQEGQQDQMPQDEQQQQGQIQEQAEQQQAPQQPQPAATPKPQSGTISTTHVDVKPSGELVVTIKAVLPKGSLMNVTGPGGSDTTAVIRGLVNHINETGSGSTSQSAPQGEATPAETSQDDSTPPPQEEIDDQQPPEVPPPSPPTNEAEQQEPVFGPLNKADQLEKNAQDTQQEFATALQESDKAQNQADTAQSNLEKEIAKAKEAQPENEDSGEVEGADQGQVQSVSEDDDKSSENEGLRQRANAKKQDSENTSQDINESESDTTAAQLDKVDPNDKNPALKKAKQEQKKTQQAAEKAAKKLEDKRRKAVAASKAKIDKQDGGKKKQTKKRKHKRKRRQTKRK